jgi:hypothetical protein
VCVCVCVCSSGKTALLQSLLGLLVRTSGFIGVRGSVSYASQNAWIFNDTVRNNILFGSKEDTAKMQSVVTACALRPDLKLVCGLRCRRKCGMCRASQSMYLVLCVVDCRCCGGDAAALRDIH